MIDLSIYRARVGVFHSKATRDVNPLYLNSKNEVFAMISLVATYVKTSHFCKYRPDLEINNLEAVWVETKINKKSYIIGSFYQPPNAAVTYWDLVEESLRKANSTNSTMVLLGDFNSDFNNPHRRIFEIMNNFSLQQLVTENTRITENTATCLDLIFTQSLDFVKNVEV